MSSDEPIDKFSVFDAPSIGADPNANPAAFKIPLSNFYQTVTPSGTITKDQVFSTATTDEVVPPDAVAQYAVYLEMSRKVKPVRGLSPEEFSINQRYIDESTRLRKKALEQIAGTQFTEAKLSKLSKEPPIKGSANEAAIKAAIDAQSEAVVLRSKITPSGLVERMNSVNQAMIDRVEELEAKANRLSVSAGVDPNEIANKIAQSTPLTPETSKFKSKFSKANSTSNSTATAASTRPLSIIETSSKQSLDETSPKVSSRDFAAIPPDEGVYAYTPAELYVDRYDFETGKKIRVGVAGGAHGGAGNSTTTGDTIQTNEQSEPFPSGPQ